MKLSQQDMGQPWLVTVKAQPALDPARQEQGPPLELEWELESLSAVRSENQRQLCLGAVLNTSPHWGHFTEHPFLSAPFGRWEN